MPDLRCFIAIDISDTLKKRITRVKKELEGINGIRTVDKENLHITLKFLGGLSADKIVKTENLLNELKFNRFYIKIRGVGAFPNYNYIRVVWVGCEGTGLTKLAEEINDKLKPISQPEEFTGHLTIARVSKKLNLREFFEKYGDFEFGRFEVTEFLLKSSELGPKGPAYSNLASFNALNSV
ncbi:RNA 2',3'-cyclic phosphodiesterase [Candidatus Micrarchaeota archaeon]|nr:RNA 2',3'-cyclic phosphodiesterase [Candidatus Micrarchaeota archaeon]